MSQCFPTRFMVVLVIALAIPASMPAEGSPAPTPSLGIIEGTVTDSNGETVPGATVVLQGPENNDRRTIVTGESGFFQFDKVPPGIPYRITIRAKDFADWTSGPATLEPGQFKILSNIQLRIEEQTTVQVKYDPAEVATEQFRVEEKQRILGIVPNYYVTYEANAEPLTAKMKFSLALKISADPVTAFGVFLIAGAKQAGNSPHYGQGWDAFGKRVGAVAGDGFTDIMIGGAILPTLLHQDPRYFYQGTGTTGSRIRHAMFSPFVSRNDNGTWGPNYSSLGGDLASSALANLYYPKQDRGVGLVLGNFAIGTAERMGASLAQEFLLSKFTRRGGHVK